MKFFKLYFLHYNIEALFYSQCFYDQCTKTDCDHTEIGLLSSVLYSNKCHHQHDKTTLKKIVMFIRFVNSMVTKLYFTWQGFACIFQTRLPFYKPVQTCHENVHSLWQLTYYLEIWCVENQIQISLSYSRILTCNLWNKFVLLISYKIGMRWYILKPCFYNWY